MTLMTWMTEKGLTDGAAGELFGLDPTTIVKLRNRSRCASLGTALQIERSTEGQVAAESLPLSKRTRAALRALRADGQAAESAA